MQRFPQIFALMVVFAGKACNSFCAFRGKRLFMGEGQWLGLSVCCGFYLDCSNLGEKLCDEWVLSASVCGTGSFSAHTATYSMNGSAHETQSFSPELRKTKNLTQTEGVLGLRTVEKRGILLEDLIHYNNE